VKERKKKKKKETLGGEEGWLEGGKEGR